jgi:conjugative relaxase-like TrwC/TraI family protein
MFTGVAQKNMAVAKSYFDEHLSHNDYYTQGEVEQGVWLGLGGEHLGLIEGQPVDRDVFMALCDGQHPGDGTRLTQRLNGAGNRRVFYDFTCSAPKSVSIMAVTMNDERILRAHQQAARFAAKELERFASTRIRINGADEDRRTGNVVGAEFLHNSSRALDPQLHTHFTMFNATFDPKERRWKALQTADIFAASKYGTEVYRNELARRLSAIGYEVEARTHGFEIKGVPPSLIKKFSKRSAERDAVISRMEQRLGRKLSNNEVSVAVHRTRSRKLKGVTTEEVRQSQLDQMTPKEIETLRQLQAAAVSPVMAPKVDEAASLDFATAHVFERASVVSEEELLRQALIHGRGQVRLDALKLGVDDDRFVRVGNEVSTREILTTELELIDTLNAGRDAFPAIAPGFESSAKLGDDQRQAVAHVLSSADQFTGFRGLAGAGKTTALQELSAAFDAAGCDGVFVAPTAAATDVLRRDGFTEAMTLQKLLVDPKEQERLAQGAVVVLDEAGLVGIDDMKRLFSLAVEKRARVVFSGDTGQHSGVARGDALRLLEEHSLYRFGQIDRIRRQHADDYREVVELAARQRPQEAFDRLDAAGHVVEPSKLYEAAAAAFLDARERGRFALLVAPTWGEIESVTEQVRARLREDGVIAGKEVTVPVFDTLGWTDAQKRQTSGYAPGQRILFQQRSGDFRQNEEVEVVAVKPDGLQVRRGDGAEQLFRPRTGTSFDVGERREIAVAPGDQLLIQANRVKDGLVNGQVVTVKSVKDGQITLDDGRALPANYRQFSHGYCVTSHASQSRTVDSVLLVASSRSAAAIHREQFYVSISRGRSECRIFTDDKELLRDRIERSTQRQAALDLVRDALAEHGLVPKVPRPIRPKRKVLPRLRPLRPLPGLVRGRAPLRQRMAGISRSVFQTMADWSERVREVVQPVVERIVSLPKPKVKVPKIKQRIRGPRL